MSPWADEFAEWRRTQSMNEERGPGLPSGPQQDEFEDVNGLEETKGCAIIDSGATVMCSSTAAAEEIQMQRLNQSEPGLPTISTSDRRFKFADGRVDEAQKAIEQPITAGLLSGESVTMHLIDKAGNDTCPLLSINELRRLRMVIDYEEGKVMFKNNPDVWRTLPTTKKGLMMIPLTKEACERYNMIPPPPQPTGKRGRKKGKDRASKVCGCGREPGLPSGSSSNC